MRPSTNKLETGTLLAEPESRQMIVADAKSAPTPPGLAGFECIVNQPPFAGACFRPKDKL